MPVTTNGHRSIAYSAAGDGPAVVLLHPLFRRGSAWTNAGYTTALSKRFRVIEIDVLGHGDSAKAATDSDYELPALVSDVVSVLDDAGVERVAGIWGYSFGGWIACGVAALARDRFSRFVVGGWDPANGMRRAYDEFQAAFGLPDDTDWFAVALEGACMAPQLLEERETWDHAALRACHDSALHSADLTASLVRSGADILFYSGSDDVAYSDISSSASALGARFVSLAGLDHESGWSSADNALPHVFDFLAP